MALQFVGERRARTLHCRQLVVEDFFGVKKRAISIAAFSELSEACTMFSWPLMPKSPRIVPGSALRQVCMRR